MDEHSPTFVSVLHLFGLFPSSCLSLTLSYLHLVFTLMGLFSSGSVALSVEWGSSVNLCVSLCCTSLFFSLPRFPSRHCLSYLHLVFTMLGLSLSGSLWPSVSNGEASFAFVSVLHLRFLFPSSCLSVSGQISPRHFFRSFCCDSALLSS